MKRFPYGWPFGYGPIEGTLMILFFVGFVLPVVFIGLWAECGFREAVRLIKEG